MGKINIKENLCKGCMLCVEFCPTKAIGVSKKLNAGSYYPAEFIKKAECKGCAICALVCPEIAIEVWREK